ncbi:hypothetical protein PG991_011916 [Apiospora marii]|uniref:Uncharacterized protein n=2 Tax=Apiospora marii TaxID=335849 RepID=A0ABR1RFW2_9PEZI
MLDYVRRNPKTCHEVLQPWVYYVPGNPHGWKSLLYERQLSHWRGFLHWQRRVRGSTDKKKHEHFDVEKMIKVFLQRQKKRNQKPGFAGYLDSVREFQFKNGFNQYWPAFNEDVGQQDMLATWFEYAFFAHCFSERAEVSVRLLQPTYDEAWRTLEAAVALKPSETQEYVRSGASSRVQYAASRHLERALATAESDLDKLKKSPPQAEEEAAPSSSCSASLSKRQQRAVEAEEQVEEVWTAFDALRERERHFAAFHQAVDDYERRRTEHERLDKQLQWILGQVAQVEFERDQARSATRGPASESSAKRSSRHGIGSAASTVRPRTLGAKQSRLQPQEACVPSGAQSGDIESQNGTSSVEIPAQSDIEAVQAPLSLTGSKAGSWPRPKRPLAKIDRVSV